MCKISCSYGLLSGTDSTKNVLGRYAVSLAGHDAGKIYLVVGAPEEGERAGKLLLSDGRSRTFEKPKAKKRMHVAVLRERDETVALMLAEGRAVDDSVLIHSLREYKQGRR